MEFKPVLNSQKVAIIIPNAVLRGSIYRTQLLSPEIGDGYFRSPAFVSKGNMVLSSVIQKRKQENKEMTAELSRVATDLGLSFLRVNCQCSIFDPG